MFSTRLKLPILALLVCGFQADQVKAMAASKVKNADIDNRPGIGKLFSKILEACKDMKEELIHKIKSKDFSNALTMIEQINDLPGEIDKKIAEINKDSADLQALTDCANSLKQDLVNALKQAAAELEAFQNDSNIKPEDVTAINSLKSKIKAIITTQDDAFFLGLIQSYETLKAKFEKPAPFNTLSGLSSACDKLIIKLHNSHPSKAEDKTTYVDLATELKNAIDAKYNHQPYTAPQKLVTSTPGSHIKWLVAGALAVTAVMTYGEVRHKMLTKMFTRLFDKMTTKAIVKLSWWGWFKHLLRLA